MTMTPRADIKANTLEFETIPLVKPTGFREYDARWWFGAPGDDPKTAKAPELNILGVQALGLGLATVIGQMGVEKKIVVGHDYRSYSANIKYALIAGLVEGGMEVHDIGLALSPVAYYAQFELDIPCVAMVTASHNENGWTGVKMGANKPLTFGPDEMGMLKDVVLGGKFETAPGGKIIRVDDMREKYEAAVTKGVAIKRPLKVVCATGNGTAGAFAPAALRKMGVEVIELECDLDYTFPNYNANPEDSEMLHAMGEAVKKYGAHVCLGQRVSGHSRR